MSENTKVYAEDIINVTPYQFQTARVSDLFAALASFHDKLSEATIQKDQEKKYKDRNGVQRVLKYASLDNILNTVRPLLSACGLSIIQNLAGPNLTTILAHESGQQIGFLTEFSPMAGNGTNNVQNIGGGITYLKRYTVGAVLNISLADDHDGDDQPQQEENPQRLPEIPYNHNTYEKAALTILSDGTPATIEKYYFIPSNVKVTLYKMALDMQAEGMTAEEAKRKIEALRKAKENAKQN